MYAQSSQTIVELFSVLAADHVSLQLLVDLGDPEVDIQRKYRSPPDCEKLVNAGLIVPTDETYRLTDFGEVIRERVLEISDLANCFEVVTAVAPILPKWDECEIFPALETLDSVEIVHGRPFEPDRPSRRLVDAITESETTPRIVNMPSEMKEQIPDCVGPDFVSLPFESESEPLNRLTFAATNSGSYLYIWAGDNRPLHESVLLAGCPDGTFTHWVADRIEEWKAA